jgi:alpha-glucosidase
VIDDSLESLTGVNAPATWVLSSHDETRLVTRYGRKTTSSAHFADGQGRPSISNSAPAGRGPPRC